MGNPSKLGSWLYWKNKLNNWSTLEELTGTKYPTRENLIRDLEIDTDKPFTGICPICNGWEELPKENVYCLCKTVHWANEKNIEYSDYRGKMGTEKLEDLELHGDPESKRKQKNFFSQIKTWINDPNTWLTISGPLGTGKTHVLKVIAHEYYPIALYVSATQFESTVFKSLKTGTLEDYIDIVSRSPILLFDDWGADYGSEIAQAKLRLVIDWRYQNPKEYPTIVTTNKSVQMMMSDAYARGDRIASRIMDKDISKVIDLSGVDDFRFIGR